VSIEAKNDPESNPRPSPMPAAGSVAGLVGASMSPISIMYHDVVEHGDAGASGFPGAGPAIYKLDREEFSRHLEAIREARRPRRELLLTFDDGGLSAYTPVAGMLEQFGWRGYFFVTTDWIGRTGFLDAPQIRELDSRGHVIGSHSCSHPERMAREPWARLLAEWKESTERLAAIVSHPVKVASVPGGYYSRRVAEAAAEAGIETLFTSEPTARVRTVNGCRVLGRYTVQRGMGPEWPAGFAAGKLGPRLRQALLWKAKGLAKAAGGPLYLRVRAVILRRASHG
jgi:peptidoglycan/xylan/chitin deacetylase (PgdA/CDA1 family)